MEMATVSHEDQCKAKSISACWSSSTLNKHAFISNFQVHGGNSIFPFITEIAVGLFSLRKQIDPSEKKKTV